MNPGLLPAEFPSIVAMFDVEVQRRPEAIAIVDAARRFTYRQVQEYSQQLAGQLSASGLAAEQAVGIVLDRSAEMVVGLLAVLRAGGAFVPVDPAWPEERRATVIRNARVTILLQESTLDESTQGLHLLRVDLGRCGGRYGHSTRPVRPDGLAYVMFTSGSTGTPKGAMIRHGAISERLLWQTRDVVGFGPDDASLFKAPLSFDISVAEIFMPLVSGGRLVIAKPGGERDPHYLLDLIARERVTFVYVVSTMLDILLDIDVESNSLRCLRHVWCGGEVLTPALYQRFRERLDIPMSHGYGPAEATIGVSHVLYRGDATRRSASIGTPNPHTELYLLDDTLSQVPVDTPGELYISGNLLGRGYVNSPGLTASRFIANPFARDGSRLYRTGDLARKRPDGCFDFLGRSDNQVKVRGMRLELEDVEAGLSAHPQVRHVAVVYRENSRGTGYLTGYVVPAGPHRGLGEQDLREWAAERLPGFMVPAHIVVLPEFPLTPNGKLDRAALPEPAVAAVAGAAPADRFEQIICDAMARSLRVERVGADQDFFAMGGDSILAISLLSAMRSAGLRVSTTQILEHTTANALARVVTDEPQPVVDPDDHAFGPTEGLPIVRWLGETTTTIAAFSQSVVVGVPEGLTAESFDRILRAVVGYHAMLRARVTGGQRWTIDIPEQVPESAEPLWWYATGPVAVSVEQGIARLAPETGAMIKAIWHRDISRLVIVAHHLVIDGVSWRILTDDLRSAWRQTQNAHDIVLPPAGTSYRRWVGLLEQCAEEFIADAEFYSAALREAGTSLARRPLDERDTVARERTTSIRLGPETTTAILVDLPARFHTGPTEVMMTALAVALARHRWSCGDERTVSCVELEGHGREERVLSDRIGFEPDLARTVGWFTTQYPVAVDPGWSASWSDPDFLIAALKRVKEQLAAVPHRGLGYGIVKYLAAVSLISETSGPEVLFNYLGRFDSNSGEPWSMADSCDELGERRDPATRLRRVLEFNVFADSDDRHAAAALTAILSWPGGVIADADAVAIGEYFRTALTAMAAVDGRGHTPSDFPLITLRQSHIDALERSSSSSVTDVVPLTPLQEGLYFHTLFDRAGPETGDGSAYVEQQILTLAGAVDPGRLRRAANRLFRLHPSLGTRFVGLDDGRVVAVVDDSVSPVFREFDFQGLPDIDARLDKIVADDAARGFDPAVAPLIRYTLICRGPQRHTMIQTVHHLVADGWSIPLMLDDLLREYHTPGTAKAGAEFADYIRWLQGRDDLTAETVWRKYLDGAKPTLVAPGHLPSRRFDDVDARPHRRASDRPLDARATVSSVVHAAWALVLGGLLGRRDVVFGSTVSGRDADVPGIETMVGLTINTIPVRVSWEADITAADLVAAVHDQQRAVADYQHVSLSTLRRLVADDATRTGATAALFDTLVVFEIPADLRGLHRPDDEFTITEMASEGAPHYPLTLVVDNSRDQLRFNLIHDTAVFSATAACRIVAAVAATFDAISEGPHQPLHSLPDIGRSPTASGVDRGHGTLTELFDDAARTYPDNIALTVCESGGGIRSVAYRRLARDKDVLADAVLRSGIAPGGLVAVICDRSAQLVTAVLAVLSAGAAYVPLDPANPDHRLRALLADAWPRIVLTTADLCERVTALLAAAGSDASVLEIDETESHRNGRGSSRPRVHPRQTAYVIYTSGSTGRPKGVAVEHRSAVALLRATASRFGFDQHDVGVAFHSFAFDFAVWELWTALAFGGRIVIPAYSSTRSPLDFHRLVAEQEITVLNQTPSAFYQFIAADEVAVEPIPSLRLVIFGGEALDVTRLRSWVDEHGDGLGRGPALVNMYGITETTVHVTVRPVTAPDIGDRDRRDSRIGCALDGLTVHILDDRLRPVPDDVPGLIYVSGDQLARGYIDRPEATATRFIANPFGPAPGARMYCTGDIGWRTDGEIGYLGRADAQIQLHGFRIEPGDIEAVLSRHPSVREALVVTTADESELVAYVVGPQQAELDSVERLAAARLPRHMVPHRLRVIDAIPLTANGKADRDALRRAASPHRAQSHDGPGDVIGTGEAVARLTQVFADALADADVDADTDFFASGGDSIVAVRVVNRALAQGISITPQDIFLQRTPRLVATRSSAAAPDTFARHQRASPAGPIPATPIMLRHKELSDDLGGFAQVRTVEFGTTTIDEVRRAANALVATHPALRLRLARPHGVWSPIIAPTAKPDVSLWRTTISESDAEPRVSVDRAAADAVSALSPEDGVMLSVRWIAALNTAVVAVHHLVIDAVSWLILLDDFTTAISGHDLPAATTPYAEYARALATSAHDPALVGELSRWQTTLQAPALVDRPLTMTYTVLDVLDEHTTRLLTHNCEEAFGVDITTLLLAALRTALTAIQHDKTPLAIDLERHGRTPVGEGHDYTRTVGWFTAIAPVLLDPETDPHAAVRAVASAIPQERTHLSYGQLRYLHPQTSPLLADLPQPQILFNYLGRREGGLRPGALSRTEGEASGTPYAVEVNTWVDGETRCLHTEMTLTSHVDAGVVTAWHEGLVAFARTAALASRSGSAPVSPLQRGLYFQADLAEDPGVYLAQSLFTFDHHLDISALHRAFGVLVTRHPTIGARFLVDDRGELVQRWDLDVDVPIAEIDLSSHTETAAQEQVSYRTGRDLDSGFAPDSAPLVRFTVFRMPAGHSVALMSYHLLLWDGWSREIVLRDLFDAYRRLRDGYDAPATPSVPTYAEVTRALAARDTAGAERFWSQYLAGLPSPTLLADRQWQAAPREVRRLEVSLSAAETDAIDRHSRTYGVTQNSYVSGALALTLGRFSGDADIVFGITVSGRDPMGMQISGMDDGSGLDGVVGVLLNTVPLRVTMSPSTRPEELLRRIHAERAGMMPHEFLGLGEIQRTSGHDQLFDSVFVLQNFLDEDALADINRGAGITEVSASDSTHFPLTWVVTPGRCLSLKLEYRPESCSEERARALFTTFRHALNRLGDPDATLGTVFRASPTERDADNIHELGSSSVIDEFDATARRHPRRTALVCNDQRTTFSGLHRATVDVAAVLRERGIGRGTKVAVAVPRSVHTVVGIFATLRAGAAYVPLELDAPDERLAAIVEDARPELVLTTSTVAARLGRIVTDTSRLLLIDTPAPGQGLENRSPGVAAWGRGLRDEAYVIYTSGSTGKPKGVVVEQAGLVNMLHNHRRRIFRPVLADHADRVFRVAHTVSFGFDMSWEELLWLIDGHEVHICDEDLRRDAIALVDYVRSQRIDVINVTPSYARQLVDIGILDAPAPPLVLLGGEAVAAELWSRLAATEGTRGYNLYGPTEYTINTLGAGTDDCDDPVVGKPIDNTAVYLLDNWMRPVPDGAVGELYVSGVGLARGYLGSTGATAARFVACPYIEGERMYRTGDLVRRRPDGHLEFLGRDDSQVKIRGHRVEPGEIESALTAHPRIRRAAVIPVHDVGTDGATALAAYVVAEPTTGEQDPSRCVADVAAVLAPLPDYLRPARMAVVESIPLTVNGKVDVRALPPASSFRSLSGAAAQAPDTPRQRAVCEVFAEAFDRDDDPDIDADFFELGGHSMLAVRVIGLLRNEFGAMVSVRDLFALRTPRRIAEHIDTASGRTESISGVAAPTG